MDRISLDCVGSKPGIPLNVSRVPIDSKYKCHKCLQILRKPVQAQCGHRFCVYCFKQLTGAGPISCEACYQEEIYEEPISILNNNEVFPDNAIGREIANFPVKCLNQDCDWIGSMKEYETQHEGRCKFEKVPCEICQTVILLMNKEKHLERECEGRILNCKYCKMTFNFKDIKAHDDICLKFPLQCKDCGKKKIPREKFIDHSRSCTKSKNVCPFSEVGCKFLIENDNLDNHENENITEHLKLLLSMVLSMTQTRPDIPSPSRDRKGGNADPSLYRAAEEGFDMDEATAAAAIEAACTQPMDLEKKVIALENVVYVLNREIERSSLTLEIFSHQHRLDQEKVENLLDLVHQLERIVSMRDAKIAETEQLVRELQFCTYDGIIVWKIKEFSRRKQDTLNGRALTIFSPAFYTSKYGYKMCLRLYLNGDGTGRGTHLSLFFVVMRGKYDALLKWPFSQKVTLMLLDQSNREHIIDAFRPDVTSTSFRQPTSEMNIASGFPLFCPLTKLEGGNPYIKDDTIFVKAIVDLTDL